MWIDTSLRRVLERMKELTNQGYDCYFEGQGNGTVKPVAEGIFITGMVNEIEKEKKKK